MSYFTLPLFVVFIALLPFVSHHIPDVFKSNPVAVATEVIILVLFLCRQLYWLRNRLKKYPPDDLGAPFLGSLIPAMKNFTVFFQNYAIKYPNDKVRTIYIFFTKIIVLQDPDAINKFFSQNNFNDRPYDLPLRSNTYDPVLYKEFGEKIDVDCTLFVDTNGPTEWLAHRKLFTSNVIAAVNSRKLERLDGDNIEKNLMPKIEDCIKNDKLWYMDGDLTYITFSLIYIAMFGDVIEETDPEYKKYIENMNGFFEQIVIYTCVNTFISKFLSNFLRNNTSIGGYDRTRALMRQTFRWYKKITSGDIISEDCLVSRYKEDLSKKKLDMSEVIIGMVTAFVGGTHTTKSVLCLATLYASKNPQMQQDVYEELKRNYPEKENFHDKFRLQSSRDLVALRAFIQEVLRMSTIADVLFRRSPKDTPCGDYIIPGRQMIAANIIGIHRNPKYYKDPNTFNMYRWLNKDNNGKYTWNKSMVTKPFFPFGSGKRSCVGQALATNEFFLVIPYLFRFYKFTDVQKKPMPKAVVVEKIDHYAVKVERRE